MFILRESGCESERGEWEERENEMREQEKERERMR